VLKHFKGETEMDQECSKIAHVREGGETHDLEQHLREVAERAVSFADGFGAGDWARLAGIWHDLGKYQPAFQRYIRAAGRLDAHIEGAPGRVDHSTVGALHAVELLGKVQGILLAYLIAGHHAGLPDHDADETGNSALVSRLTRARENGLLTATLQASPPQDLPGFPEPLGGLPGDSRSEKLEGLHLWLRMLFSCLVDADFLDTEAFMQPGMAALRSPYPPVGELLTHFSLFMETMISGAAPTPVNRLRKEVYERCCERAQEPAGRFSLTVPTGGGKTLASLGFALNHAKAHGKRRVVYVIPYTSIIEQTADVFRKVFAALGRDVVIEHHSNAETAPENESQRTRLACENWDAPLLVTTSVQFFESLYAARTSRVRKLHNLVDSIVILDEAQLLPPEFRKSILSTLRQLTEHYGVTLVLCTATQPALGTVDDFEGGYRGLDGMREIMADPADLHRRLRRVRVELPESLDSPLAWEDLAEKLQSHPSALCIVNRRDDCRTLHALMPEGTVHLSALMCGQHRADVIEHVKDRLKDGSTVRVISTQLVEAGVDLDFPVVYRALAGLDSLAQAAGRCNREGRLDGLGEVRLFVPPGRNMGLIYKAEQAARELLHGFEGDLLEPALFAKFFRLFYGRIDPDKGGIEKLLVPDGGLSIAFRTAAERFRLIDDGYHLPVFVAYGRRGWERIDELRRLGPDRRLMRSLQRYSVNVTKQDHQHLLADGFIEEVFPGIFVQARPELYDDTLGVLTDPQMSSESLVL
jgi:CRISPR-associated endonuclease/helicase Cas3